MVKTLIANCHCMKDKRANYFKINTWMQIYNQMFLWDHRLLTDLCFHVCRWCALMTFRDATETWLAVVLTNPGNSTAYNTLHPIHADLDLPNLHGLGGELALHNDSLQQLPLMHSAVWFTSKEGINYPWFGGSLTPLGYWGAFKCGEEVIC